MVQDHLSLQNLKIYENTRIIEMTKCQDSYICYTDKHKITANKVIIASHYPFFLKPYMFPLKVYNEKSYVTASKIKEYNDMIADAHSKLTNADKEYQLEAWAKFFTATTWEENTSEKKLNEATAERNSTIAEKDALIAELKAQLKQ